MSETSNAVRLVEDYAYRCRLVNGVLYWRNLEMSTLASQLCTSAGAHYQSFKDGQLMANRYYRKSAALHESLLTDPSLAEENDLNSGKSIDDFEVDLDLTDTANGPSVSDAELVR